MDLLLSHANLHLEPPRTPPVASLPWPGKSSSPSFLLSFFLHARREFLLLWSKVRCILSSAHPKKIVGRLVGPTKLNQAVLPP